MKLGFVSAILGQSSFEEMIDTAHELGFACIEAASWPEGRAERRYAGVSHIDAERVLTDESYAKHITEYARERGVEISSLAYYPNTMDPDLEKRQMAISHLMYVIKASKILGVNMVTTFIGRDQTKTVEENLELVKRVWPEILSVAEEGKVRIAIPTSPKLFGAERRWGRQNLMTTPKIWGEVLAILQSDYLGINYDPSHFVWQMIDYIKPIYEFKDKIFHVHFKDIKIFKDKLDQVGIMAYPLEFMSPKLPGLGDVDWGRYVSALTDINYNGYACIEVEDKAFEGSKEAVRNSLILSKRYMDQFVI